MGKCEQRKRKQAARRPTKRICRCKHCGSRTPRRFLTLAAEHPILGRIVGWRVPDRVPVNPARQAGFRLFEFRKDSRVCLHCKDKAHEILMAAIEEGIQVSDAAQLVAASRHAQEEPDNRDSDDEVEDEGASDDDRYFMQGPEDGDGDEANEAIDGGEVDATEIADGVTGHHTAGSSAQEAQSFALTGAVKQSKERTGSQELGVAGVGGAMATGMSSVVREGVKKARGNDSHPASVPQEDVLPNDDSARRIVKMPKGTWHNRVQESDREGVDATNGPISKKAHSHDPRACSLSQDMLMHDGDGNPDFVELLKEMELRGMHTGGDGGGGGMQLSRGPQGVEEVREVVAWVGVGGAAGQETGASGTAAPAAGSHVTGDAGVALPIAHTSLHGASSSKLTGSATVASRARVPVYHGAGGVDDAAASMDMARHDCREAVRFKRQPVVIRGKPRPGSDAWRQHPELALDHAHLWTVKFNQRKAVMYTTLRYIGRGSVSFNQRKAVMYTTLRYIGRGSVSTLFNESRCAVVGLYGPSYDHDAMHGRATLNQALQPGFPPDPDEGFFVLVARLPTDEAGWNTIWDSLADTIEPCTRVLKQTRVDPSTEERRGRLLFAMSPDQDVEVGQRQTPDGLPQRGSCPMDLKEAGVGPWAFALDPAATPASFDQQKAGSYGERFDLIFDITNRGTGTGQLHVLSAGRFDAQALHAIHKAWFILNMNYAAINEVIGLQLGDEGMPEPPIFGRYDVAVHLPNYAKVKAGGSAVASWIVGFWGACANVPCASRVLFVDTLNLRAETELAGGFLSKIRGWLQEERGIEPALKEEWAEMGQPDRPYSTIVISQRRVRAGNVVYANTEADPADELATWYCAVGAQIDVQAVSTVAGALRLGLQPGLPPLRETLLTSASGRVPHVCAIGDVEGVRVPVDIEFATMPLQLARSPSVCSARRR